MRCAYEASLSIMAFTFECIRLPEHRISIHESMLRLAMIRCVYFSTQIREIIAFKHFVECTVLENHVKQL